MAQKLLNRHLYDYRPNELPYYEYEQLKKGIYCPRCYSFAHINTRQTRICTCGYKEAIREAIRRSAEEFQVLFPEMEMTTGVIHEWCGGEYAKHRIRETLQAFFEAHGKGSATYYV